MESTGWGLRERWCGMPGRDGQGVATSQQFLCFPAGAASRARVTFGFWASEQSVVLKSMRDLAFVRVSKAMPTSLVVPLEREGDVGDIGWKQKYLGSNTSEL